MNAPRPIVDKRVPKPSLIRRFFGALGPGVITGAADDDPSGIATYSQAGASLGSSLLWTALVTWPLMASVQMMCARIGMVSGRGLAAAFRKKFPRPLLILSCVALLVANTINVGADLAGMADAAEMVSGFPSHVFVVVFGVVIAIATIKLRYFQIANIMKWLVLVLFSYVIVAFKVVPDWHPILRDTLIPSLPRDKDGWRMLVGILGTTISPYLFFWQSSQEIEEEKASGRNTLRERKGATANEIIDRKLDVGLGTFFSNFVMFFIIVSTAATLHRHGIRDIETSRQAAEALLPLAGRFAATIFTVGVLGVGFLAIPTLTGSAAYAFAETFGWRQGLDQKLEKARAFYGVILLSTTMGIVLDFAHVNPVKALYWTAILNGLLAPFLLVGILIVACDSEIMCGQPSSLWGRITVGLTTALMFAAGIAMFVV